MLANYNIIEYFIWMTYRFDTSLGYNNSSKTRKVEWLGGSGGSEKHEKKF